MPAVLLQHMGGRLKGVIHVGANTGQELDYYQATNIRRAVLIEPLDEPYRVLCQRIEERELTTYIPVQALCSEVDGAAYDFFVASNGGESSSFLRPARHLAEAPEVRFDAKVRLQSRTLDSIIAEVEAATPGFTLADLDALVLDAQGAELHVLKGANRVLQQVTYIRSEVSFGGLYEGDSPLEEIQGFLKCYGFRMFDLEMVRQGWGDACFFKR